MKKISEKKKVLFICTHNSARSQMAEGILRDFYGNRYEVYSAGTEPSKINPHAVRVMNEIGIDISHQHSKSINEFHDKEFDYVITVCDHAKESCPFFPGGVIIHKGFKDPVQSGRNEEEILSTFRQIRDEIKDWIKKTFKHKDWKEIVKPNIR